MFGTECMIFRQGRPSLNFLLQSQLTVKQAGNEKTEIDHILYAFDQGIAGGVPRQCTDYMAEILFALNRHNVTLLSRWMQVRVAIFCCYMEVKIRDFIY